VPPGRPHQPVIHCQEYVRAAASARVRSTRVCVWSSKGRFSQQPSMQIFGRDFLLNRAKVMNAAARFWWSAIDRDANTIDKKGFIR
jgi:hypothetical protein